MISSRPEATASSTTYWMVGLSTRGSISLGWALVAGRKRVPRPAAGKTALRTFIETDDTRASEERKRVRPTAPRRGCGPGCRASRSGTRGCARSESTIAPANTCGRSLIAARSEGPAQTDLCVEAAAEPHLHRHSGVQAPDRERPRPVGPAEVDL